MAALTQTFWNAPFEDLKRGYTFENDEWVCLVCGERFLQGRIYSLFDALYEAEKYTQMHIAEQHGSMLAYLLSLDKKFTGLTDHQKNIIRSFHEGKTDSDIAADIGASPATIRSHRFALRERARQAKLLLAVVGLMEESGASTAPKFVEIHRTARMVDERYMVTEQESQKILEKYFPNGTDSALSEFPRKEKRKLVILRHLVTRFDANRQYTEREVNEILEQAYPDYVTLRRYLIEYGFLDRHSDGSAYWVKDRP